MNRGEHKMTVTPIMGRAFCFYVSSRSGGDDRYVDWLDETCTCPAWGMAQREHRIKTGQPYICAHLEASMWQCWSEIREHTKEQLLTQ